MHKDVGKLREMKNNEIIKERFTYDNILNLFGHLENRRSVEEQVISSHIAAEHDEALLKSFKVLDDSANSLYNQTTGRHDMLRLLGDKMSDEIKKALQKA